MTGTDLQKILGCTLDSGGQILSISTSGNLISDADKKEILQKVRSGEPVRLEMDIRAFQQTAMPNRRFARFKDSKLAAGAKSFAGKPFLRDHAQGNLLARGGTILASKLDEIDGGKAMNQTVELVAPWAVEMAVLGLMDRFSIGWWPTGPVLCTVCENPLISRDCIHWPGQMYDGKLCEVLYTDFVGVETSGVSVPAVVDTGIEEIRAALSAARQEGAGAKPRQEKRPMLQFSKLSTILSLSEDADESVVVGAVQKLIGEVESHRTLLAAEREARETTAKALEIANTELSTVRHARQESELSEILQTATRSGRLVPRTVLGEDGKPRRVEGDIEAAIRLQARMHGVKAARDYAESLPVVVPVGPSITDTTAAKAQRRALAAPAGGSILRQMGVSMADVQKYGRIGATATAAEDDE